METALLVPFQPQTQQTGFASRKYSPLVKECDTSVQQYELTSVNSQWLSHVFTSVTSVAACAYHRRDLQPSLTSLSTASSGSPLLVLVLCSPFLHLAPASREVGLRDSELEKLEGRKELFILYFIKTNVICALRTACVHCAVVGGH
jgi:hypothetical protein